MMMSFFLRCFLGWFSGFKTGGAIVENAYFTMGILTFLKKLRFIFNDDFYCVSGAPRERTREEKRCHLV